MRNQIDRLSDIRATIRGLRAEAKLIQAQILAGEVSLEGDDHVATVRRQIVIKPVFGCGLVAGQGNGARPVPMQHPPMPMQHPTMWGSDE